MENMIYVLYTKSNNNKDVVGWSDIYDNIIKYKYTVPNDKYKLKCMSMSKLIKKFGNLEDKEIVEYDGKIFIKEELSNMINVTKDEELYNLASCISYMSTIEDKYIRNLEGNDLKHINKAITTMKYLFHLIEEEYDIEKNILPEISVSALEEFKKQKDFLNTI